MVLITVRCFAVVGDPASDSLRTELLRSINKSPSFDTAAINKINKLSSEYISSYPDSALYYGEIAIKSARKINYGIGIADGLYNCANTYLDQGKYTLLNKYLSEAMAIYNVSKDTGGLSDCYKVYAYLYIKEANYQKALFYLNKALQIKKGIKDDAGIARIYLVYGNTYSDMGRISTALDYYFKSLNINTGIHNERAMAANYNNIGCALQTLEIYPEALAYFKRALKTWRKLGIYGGISTTTVNIGEVLLAQGKYTAAITYINECLKIAEKQDDKENICEGYNSLGLCYLYEHQNEQAKYYFDQSLKVALDNSLNNSKITALVSIALYYNTNLDFTKAINYALKGKTLSDSLGNNALKAGACKQLIRGLGGAGKYQEAFFAQKELDRLKATYKSDESVQRFSSYNVEYKYAARQREQALKQKAAALEYRQKIRAERLLNIIFFIIASAVIIIAVMYYRQKRKQLKINKKLVEKNQQVLQQKIDLDDQAEKLNELNKLKDRLIGILAHDLRSPLSTLRGLFTLLEDESISHEEMLLLLPDVLKKLDYTSDFLDTLLFWINSQMENFTNSVKSFSINEVIDAELDHYREQASLKDIHLSGNLMPGGDAIGDPNSLRIVVRNLLTNAIKFSNRGDTIEISSALLERDILIAVKDTGTGMTSSQRDRLFKSKVESKSGTKNESGTGMGMLFCRDLVEKNNGTIWVESEFGKGTAFYFTIPHSSEPRSTANIAISEMIG